LTRSDLAQALARLTRLNGVSASPNPSISVPDLPPSNGIYPDLQLILNLGVMAVDESGRFNLGAEVSGRDGVRAAEGLLRTFQQAQR